MNSAYFKTRLSILNQDFQSAINSKYYSYDETRKLKACGVYIISNASNEVIYVGKTGRNGKTRLRELVSDYRSHTLNRKLLRSLLVETLQRDNLKLTNKTKRELIDKGDFSEEEFKSLQKSINHKIKMDYRFQFYEVEQDRITEIEHFFIAVFNPKFND